MNRPPCGVITLITDFGLRDSYVGTMKGVIHSVHRQATIVDLTHEIEPQDLMEGAFVLENSYRFFPIGTVHVVVVDPGVGTRRKPIVVDTPEHIFVGPDNGIFSRIYASSTYEVREITNRNFLLPQISDTFHGRDVFAPAAAHLSRGVPAMELGPILETPLRSDPPQPGVWQDQITGEVIHIDSFGNLITNVTREVFEMVAKGKRLRIVINGKTIDRICRNYQEVEPSRPLALFGSMDLLEIAVHNGRADRRMGVGRGDPIQIFTES
jgi:S-adenosyl-L-methionine hydrolase (adenosine-forming)